MLFPQSNPYRQVIELPDFWDFRFDPDDAGLTSDWSGGFDQSRPIAVPASWNDQFEDGRDFLSPAWYQVRFDRPLGFPGQRNWLRFHSVNYLAEVWLNGQLLGAHEGGHLPFEFDVTGRLQREGNLLVVRVDGSLAPDRVPPGNVPEDPHDSFGMTPLPPASFDFFPYCGIQRPVRLYSTPQAFIQDIGTVTDIPGDKGLVTVDLDVLGEGDLTALLTLKDHGTDRSEEVKVVGGRAAAQFLLNDPALWSPQRPNLYELTVWLMEDGKTVDRYRLPVGIRTIAVQGDRLLLNGEPIHLTGFGRHEDFPVNGRGYNPAVIVKDYAILQWVGANSFRTTHYPYSEEMMDLADRLGFLVIDETPAVGLFFAEQGLDRRLELCRQYTRELIERDRNHPSVIAWSLANEPHSKRPAAKAFFRELYDLAKSLDSTRPATLVSTVNPGQEEAFEFMDFLCLNRYYGWYTNYGDLDTAVERLKAEVEQLHALYPKPLVLTEFGADTIPGHHAQPPEMFSEEYQAEMLERYILALREYPFVAGEHVWNLCDFKTGQAVHRVGGFNYKGVFTRDRRPKMAAHKLRELWGKA